MDNTHHTGAVLRNVVILNRLRQGGSRRYASPTMAPRRPGGGRVRTAQGRRPSAVERTGRHAPYARRNLIDDYFGLGEEICYRDFDLLAMGPVVSQAEAAFDQYWNSQWAYPIRSLGKPPSQAEQDQTLHSFSERVAADRANFPYALPHDRDTARAWLVQFRGEGIWGPAEPVYDDPDSVANPADAPPGRVWKKMNSLAMEAQHEIVLANPYLLP